VFVFVELALAAAAAAAAAGSAALTAYASTSKREAAREATAASLTVGPLYKLNPIVTRSLKAPGVNSSLENLPIK
jgi:hypothetical protein